MPEWLALCDLGAPGGGEPWFPHSAVLVFPHKSLDGEFCVVFEFVCFFFGRHLNPFDDAKALSLYTGRFPYIMPFFVWFSVWCLWGVFLLFCLFFVPFRHYDGSIGLCTGPATRPTFDYFSTKPGSIETNPTLVVEVSNVKLISI